MSFEKIDLDIITEEQSVVLQHITEITEDILNINPDPWKGMVNQYRSCVDKPIVVKSVVSIMNSIFTHRRVVFCFNREKLRALLKSDKNWKNMKKRVSLKNSNYTTILKLLHHNNIVKEVEQSSRKIMVLELVNPEMLRSLNPSMTRDQQMEQCLDFASRRRGRGNPADMVDDKTAIKPIDEKPATKEWVELRERAKARKERGKL